MQWRVVVLPHAREYLTVYTSVAETSERHSVLVRTSGIKIIITYSTLQGTDGSVINEFTKCMEAFLLRERSYLRPHCVALFCAALHAGIVCCVPDGTNGLADGHPDIPYYSFPGDVKNLFVRMLHVPLSGLISIKSYVGCVPSASVLRLILFPSRGNFQSSVKGTKVDAVVAQVIF